MSAESIYRDGEKKINKIFFKDYDGAMELFDKAAARFKIEKNYSRAGDAYMRAGDCAVKSKDSIAAGQAYANAANAFKKVDLRKAAQMLEIATHMQIDMNRLGSAARLEKDFADALDEAGQSMEAIPHYEKAQQFFAAEDLNSQVQSCMVAMAKIYGENDMFDKALTLYEQLGGMCAEGPLRYQAKEHYLRALLCRLATVTDDNRHEQSAECVEALTAYKSRDIYLKNTRESEFMEMCVESVEESDVEKFETAVSLLQDLRMLDDWKTHVLLVIKRNFESIL